MKLEEIDQLVHLKSTYQSLTHALGYMNRLPESVQYYGIPKITNAETLKAVHELVLSDTSRQLEEVKAKLMLAGFDEFPE